MNKLDFTIDLDPGFDAEMEVISRRLVGDPALKMTIGDLANFLVMMSKVETTTGEERMGFLNPALTERVRWVGEQVHARLGWRGMQYVHSYVSTIVPHDARSLEYAWDGIGEWKA